MRLRIRRRMGPYPVALEAQERAMIWGGRALVERYGKPGDPSAAIGESWECWDENKILNGSLRGARLADARNRWGRDLTGRADPDRIFPLLTKFIDAATALSVQVHPNDEYAQRVEKQPVGKTESWYVLEAEPEATIVLGWSRATTRGEYLERVREGTLEDVLRRVPVQAGDVFHLPSGTVHAIGAGIVLFEVQQASDLTYRMYDYNRNGPDGKPRELHVEKAADVLDYSAATGGALRSLAYALDGLERTTLVADKNFWFERIALRNDARGIDLEGMPLAVTALDLPLELEAQGDTIRLEPYESAVIPAGLDVVMASALMPGASLLAAAPPASATAIAKRFSRAGIDVGKASSFLAQFP